MGDIKEAIKKVLTESKSKKELKKIGMTEGSPLKSFSLTYDAPTTHLESIYFWLLDFLQDMSKDGVEKITDNFTASPGSGHFAEIGARTTRMQDEGMKILGGINQVTKSILNLLYDLKEFEIRLEHYEDANSPESEKREKGMLALKQIWMDNVDMKKGRGSINQMTFELGFSTLRDAFMVCNSVEDVKKNEIVNEQIKRILTPRISEFLKWKDYSHQELKKRFEIEKSYLRTQTETLRLYTSWVRPYLKAAEALRMEGFEKNPALVNAFNTTMFELVLLGKTKVDFDEAVKGKKLPPGFLGYKLKRNYYSCYVVSLVFRGFPQKVTQQHYGFGGRIDMRFDCYSLNDNELELVKKQLKDQDLKTSLGFVQEATDESLKQLEEDIKHFLEDKKKEEKEEKKKEDINPFSALISLFKPKKKEEKKKEILEIKDIKKDNYVEGEIRTLAAASAKESLYKIYDIYKKAHAMASSPEPFD